MEQIIINVNNYLNKFNKKKKPLHEKAAIVDEIIELTGKSDVYNYGYWLKKLKQFEQQGGQLGMIYGWLKEINQISRKYNLGGILTNKFKQWRKETKK